MGSSDLYIPEIERLSKEGYFLGTISGCFLSPLSWLFILPTSLVLHLQKKHVLYHELKAEKKIGSSEYAS